MSRSARPFPAWVLPAPRTHQRHHHLSRGTTARGGSFSTRIVRAVQQGETIFMMTTSFSVMDPGPEHQFQMPRTRCRQAREVDLASRVFCPAPSGRITTFPINR